LTVNLPTAGCWPARELIRAQPFDQIQAGRSQRDELLAAPGGGTPLQLRLIERSDLSPQYFRRRPQQTGDLGQVGWASELGLVGHRSTPISG
jgi:hypothetical protein